MLGCTFEDGSSSSNTERQSTMRSLPISEDE